ncbi:phosphatidate cytidylyltransferase [Peptoniphilus sp. KCTC 25270]|uniref:phosphatidate cytidylyltransferase n=1 Tax=Peptoniphilus sp. KCTC 25270 TaxID=2897414 RepID=UPI001E461B19|nr:phosphatidate cytidylyltransferase [Peptoniphilus sp. KCTC 25270]MCD1146982.1 phosphatidate cytidylyltransferase [Peptoniphilus sp. KCTC 25270]
MSEFKKRVITGVIAFIVLAFFIVIGGWPFKLAILFVSLALCHELSHALKNKDYHIPEPLILLGCIFHYIAFQFELPMFIALAFSCFFLLIQFLINDNFHLEDAAVSVLILVYIPFFLFPIIHLSGTVYIYSIFVIAFATDIFAYLTGMSIGKHKLIPKVSPNKTIEGAIGGIVGAIVCGGIYFYFSDIKLTWIYIVFLAASSISGQLGDLFASKIKRETGIKDYGKALPGHGGFMDRFDSILLIIPMVYLLYWIH